MEGTREEASGKGKGVSNLSCRASTLGELAKTQSLEARSIKERRESGGPVGKPPRATSQGDTSHQTRTLTLG